VQFMPPDSQAFGNELIMALRRTREFGMIVSSGVGGTDTEVFAERFRKGQAVVAASPEMTDAETFFELYRKTISYKKASGLSRGQTQTILAGHPLLPDWSTPAPEQTRIDPKADALLSASDIAALGAAKGKEDESGR